SFAELKGGGLDARVRGLLTPEQTRALDQIAPELVALPRGRKVRLVYPASPPGEAPHAASRLQDFFGMRDGPRVARGKVPVVLELLAPNRRAVQVTSDLAGFWARHYPAIAKELRRRYPKHPFPDDPLA
ncbi:MAG TPA: ATP-dependent helicase C-terminal domain-containing protein, partial [Minicystis sp.]|nr:ATP-dependent helicase C-terminal domain-containing protein [Minicystis sp.]